MSTKKLGRVMWTHSACGDELVLRHTNPPSYNRKPVVVLDLSDPAALVEAITDVLCTSPNGRKDLAPDWFREGKHIEAVAIAKRLGVPAKLLKERKKK